MLTDPNLKSKVDSLWDRFWSGGIANPLTAIEQMSYLIFLKRLEDRDNAQKKSAERRGQPVKSIFVTIQMSSKKGKTITGKTIKSFI